MTQTTSGNNLEMKEYMFYHEREEKMIWNMITSRKRKRTTTKIFSQSLITKNGFGDFAVLFFEKNKVKDRSISLGDAFRDQWT